MKPALKRIEATLHTLDQETPTYTYASSCKEPAHSYKLNTNTPLSEPEDQNAANSRSFFPHQGSVQTFPIEDQGQKTPALPKFKTPNFSSHRHGANPALALNLLQEIQANITSWQIELHKLVREIQDIYLEGPIVDGWLESHKTEFPTGGTATLRHADIERLMDYVEEICHPTGNNTQSNRAGYRLCSLDETGKVWSRPCPPEQVPALSIAIARNQKLRQMLGRKQYLETRLSQLAETLVVLHSHIQSA
ncbi:MAG: hypothetical protein H0X31_07725 [Nostocaceae cyanobacterium]|nr:hypothetical protein [Nostocaceae cyanobacterium]